MSALLQTKEAASPTLWGGATAALTSSEPRKLLALGWRWGWDVRVIGRAPMLEEPVALDGAWLIPAEQDTSPIPAWALERVRTIYDAGVRPEGFVLAHEAPKLLPPPAESEPEPFRLLTLSPQIRAALKTAGTVVAAVGLGLLLLPALVAVASALFMAAAVLLIPVALVGGALSVDPVLIAVVPDRSGQGSVWIEVARWDTPTA